MHLDCFQKPSRREDISVSTSHLNDPTANQAHPLLSCPLHALKQPTPLTSSKKLSKHDAEILRGLQSCQAHDVGMNALTFFLSSASKDFNMLPTNLCGRSAGPLSRPLDILAPAALDDGQISAIQLVSKLLPSTRWGITDDQSCSWGKCRMVLGLRMGQLGIVSFVAQRFGCFQKKACSIRSKIKLYLPQKMIIQEIDKYFIFDDTKYSNKGWCWWLNL